MARIYVSYPDGGNAAGVRVGVSVDGGGMSSGFTGSDGWANISTSVSSGKVIVNGFTVHNGNLDGARVTYRK